MLPQKKKKEWSPKFALKWKIDWRFIISGWDRGLGVRLKVFFFNGSNTDCRKILAHFYVKNIITLLNLWLGGSCLYAEIKRGHFIYES